IEGTPGGDLNRALPPGNRGHRGSDSFRQSGPGRLVLGASRLVGGIAAREAERPATAFPDGPARAGIASSPYRIAALPIFALGGFERQSELLAHGSGQKPAD